MKVDNRAKRALVENQEVFDRVVDHISNGGSLLDFCRMLGFKYSDVMRFIRSNPARRATYEQALVDRKEWAQERVISEIRALATYSIKDAMNQDGTFKRLAEMPDELASAIKEIDADGAVKFSDKLKALEMLGRQIGMFVEKKEVSGKVTLEQLILAASSSDKE